MSCRPLLAMIGVVLLALGVAQPTASAQTIVGDSAASMKLAAGVRIEQNVSDVLISELVVERVVGDYATVRVVAGPDQPDLGLVLVHRDAGGWTAIGGPSPSFPPGDPARADAPDALFDAINPYVGPAAQEGLHRLPSGTQIYDGYRLTFEHPGDTVAVPALCAPRDRVLMYGPTQQRGTEERPAYEIEVEDLEETLLVPLDEWGYAQAQAQLDAFLAGSDGSEIALASMSYFQTPTNRVFLVEWSVEGWELRQFYVATPGHAAVVKLTSRVFPLEGDFATHLAAQSAETLLLQTLSATGQYVCQALYTHTDSLIGYAVTYPCYWTLIPQAGGTSSLTAPDGTRVEMGPLPQTTLDEAVDDTVPDTALVLQDTLTLVNGLSTRMVRLRDAGTSEEELRYYVQLDSARVLLLRANGGLVAAEVILSSVRAANATEPMVQETPPQSVGDVTPIGDSPERDAPQPSAAADSASETTPVEADEQLAEPPAGPADSPDAECTLPEP